MHMQNVTKPVSERGHRQRPELTPKQLDDIRLFQNGSTCEKGNTDPDLQCMTGAQVLLIAELLLV